MYAAEIFFQIFPAAQKTEDIRMVKSLIIYISQILFLMKSPALLLEYIVPGLQPVPGVLPL